MLDDQGKISFAEELLDAVARFLDEYQTREGSLGSELERGLVISYVLGVMRCDLDAVWDCLGGATVFGALHPRAVFESCNCDAPVAAERRAAILAELRRRGWLEMRDET